MSFIAKIKCWLGFHELKERIERFTLGPPPFAGTSVYATIKCDKCGKRKYMEAIGFEHQIPTQDGLKKYSYGLARYV